MACVRARWLTTELPAGAAGPGCDYIRCSNNRDNPGETALFRKSGFALVDLNGEDDQEPCYLAARPVRNEDARRVDRLPCGCDAPWGPLKGGGG